MKSNTVPWRNHIHAVGLGMAVSIGGLTPAWAQTQVPISGLAPYSACTPDQIQTAQKATKLEIVTDVAHLVRQIYANLDKGVLCADPEWLEKQWGIRIFDWRGERGLFGPEVQWDSRYRQVEPPPLTRYMARLVSWVKDGKAFSRMTIGFAGRQGELGESFMPSAEILALLGEPLSKETYWDNPAPPDPTKPFPEPAQIKYGGNLQKLHLRWQPSPQVLVTTSTGYQSEIQYLTITQAIQISRGDKK